MSRRVLLALLVQTAIAAGTYLVGKRAMLEIAPTNLAVTRMLLSAVVFAVLLALTPGRKLPPRRLLLPVAALGLICGPLNQGFFLYGLSRSTPAHASLLFALTPVGVYAVELAAGREYFAWDRLVGVGLAFCGATVLLAGAGSTPLQGPLVGDLFILGAVTAWVLFSTEGKRFTLESGAIRVTAWSMIGAGLWCLPFAPKLLNAAELSSASPTAVGCVAFLVVMTSGVSYLLWYYALARCEASRVAVFSNLHPVVTAFAAWAVFGDSIVWEVYAGGALVLLGVRLAQRA